MPEQRRVPGRVTLETDEPVVLRGSSTLGDQLAEIRERHPWLLPGLLGLLLVVVILSRRR